MTFAGFLSYTRLDDQYGRVTEFRERLENAVRQWTGEPGFQIFQDTKDIRWGQQFGDQIDQALADVLIMIPIMTPLYFNSGACREEYAQFLTREERLGRNDLILPVYWMDCDVLEDREALDADPWATGLASHQRVDWRQFRARPFDAPEIVQTFDGLALQIKQILGATAPLPPANGAEERDAAQQEEEASQTQEAQVEGVVQRGTDAVSVATEPPTHFVDAMGRGDYNSLVDAVRESKAGDRLLVRPGFYPGGLVLDKPLEIIGVGDASEIVVQATGSSVILFKANMGIVRNVTIRQVGGGDYWFAVDITQGHLVLEQCDISSQSLACVAVHDGADPLVRSNRIHDGKAGGIFIFDNGKGIFEENEVSENARSGIEVKEDGDPAVRRNRIHDGKAGGILVRENGRGTFEENEVSGNALSGIEVRQGGDPVVRRNHIHNGKVGGIMVHENGRGTFEENEVSGNARAGVTVRQGRDPVLRRNRITGNAHEAIWVYDNGAGTFEDNDLRGNERGSWLIGEGCEVTRARNQEDGSS